MVTPSPSLDRLHEQNRPEPNQGKALAIANGPLAVLHSRAAISYPAKCGIGEHRLTIKAEETCREHVVLFCDWFRNMGILCDV